MNEIATKNREVEQPPCPKCTAREHSIRWHIGISQKMGSPTGANCMDDRCVLQFPEEHLHYTCDVCGYEWRGDVAS